MKVLVPVKRVVDYNVKVRVKSASLGLHDAAKVIDRVHDLKRMGRIAA